jgi:hypothetical protein
MPLGTEKKRKKKRGNDKKNPFFIVKSLFSFK